jgi:hypothetical protein
LVARHEDPIRAQRPTYAVADPFLQFHYAILDPHRALLRERDPKETWARQLSPLFHALVRGPVFREQARSWVRRHADPSSLGGAPSHVGPTSVVTGGREQAIDVVVAASGDGSAPPGERRVLALGNARAGEAVGREHLRELEGARRTLGTRASDARLLLFAPSFTSDLEGEAAARGDLEMIGLERLYHGE